MLRRICNTITGFVCSNYIHSFNVLKEKAIEEKQHRHYDLSSVAHLFPTKCDLRCPEVFHLASICHFRKVPVSHRCI